ncbi:hypothetical protein MAR_021483 [Mya arenaria]|uniref:Tyrosine-protein phosphatase domain-containing protein n=1 Tax=Mya arenaria TaxID=6604 RepID=A0ABY7EAI2_MYAAR|nr:hypothetical protein MAR_021483 [Mya arenaria]
MEYFKKYREHQSKQTVVHQFTAWPGYVNICERTTMTQFLQTTDKEVAIAETVRLVKYRRQAAVADVEQYQFCHEVVFEYLKNRGGKLEDSENQEYVNMTFPKFL